MIGIGLGFIGDITLRGLDHLERCDNVYLDGYTSVGVDPKKLSKFYKKEVVVLERHEVETKPKFIDEAKKKDVAFLVYGSVFSATTHIDVYLRAKKKKVDVVVIENASILNAIGITGLSLYNFGRVISIPFDLAAKSPIQHFDENESIGLHTLFLLDLDPFNKKFLGVDQACDYLIKNGVKNKALVCARIGSEDFMIKYGSLGVLRKIDFGDPPYCIIIPGRMHFVEEEALKAWK